MQRVGHSADAIRQIEYWYKHYIDSFVHDARTAPRPINGVVIAGAHTTAWNHAVVRAQKSTHHADWAAITDVDESHAYLELVQWSSAKYRVSLDTVLSA